MFDFELTQEEMKKMASLNKEKRYFNMTYQQIKDWMERSTLVALHSKELRTVGLKELAICQTISAAWVVKNRMQDLESLPMFKRV